jgi:hypothetical protein
MANPRRRTSGFTSDSEVNEDTSAVCMTEDTLVEEFLEEAVTEMVEIISHNEAQVTEETPFVAPSIAPTPDCGPRFIPKEEQPVATTPKAPPQPVAPRRHPRNVPKFSRTK